MSFHIYRQSSAGGYRKPAKHGKQTVTIAARLEEKDFEELVELAHKRRVPISAILREAALKYLKRARARGDAIQR